MVYEGWLSRGAGGAAAPLSPRAQCDVATRHVRWQHTPGEVQRTKVTFFLPVVYRRAPSSSFPSSFSSIRLYIAVQRATTGISLGIRKISRPTTTAWLILVSILSSSVEGEKERHGGEKERERTQEIGRKRDRERARERKRREGGRKKGA